MHATIVIAVRILGNHNVKPSALFAKVFAAVPKTTAKTKNKYETIVLILNTPFK
jgi:hypothetical protein